MKRDETKLTPRQLRAIDALLSEVIMDAASAKAGVSRVQLWRWLQQPDFSQVYRQARARLLETTLIALQAASSQAVYTLFKVMTDAKANDGAKVSAARATLEFALKGREALDLEDRLRALEDRIAEQEAFGEGRKRWG